MEHTPSFAIAQAIAVRLGLDPQNKGVWMAANQLDKITRLDQNAYLIEGSQGNTYEVTADTCGCPAYVLPTEAGDEPRLCYHRIAVIVLNGHEAALAGYQAVMNVGDVPVELPRVDMPPCGIPVEESADVQQRWIAWQQERGMIIHEGMMKSPERRRRSRPDVERPTEP